MKKILYRFIIALAVLGTGVLLLASITYVGKETAGPAEDLFSKIANAVATIENKYILKKRKKSRSLALEGFIGYKTDRSTLQNPEILLLGAYDDRANSNFQAIVDLEDSLKTVFPLIQIYAAWGSKRTQRFPATEVNSIAALGSIPVITWEPWLTDFDKESMPGLPDSEVRDLEGLKAISRGVYDVYIDRWAADAKASGHLMFVRYGHEMNDPYRYPWGPQNNDFEDYVAAWRHIVDRFRALRADNVLWVWSPHPAYGQFEEYYPGEEYVDWIGTGTLNYGTVAPWSQWWSFDEIFAKHYELMAEYKKPIMISEFGSLAVGGNRAEWFKDALTDLPARYPAVKALLFFHDSKDATTTYQVLNWHIKEHPQVIDEVVTALTTWPKGYLVKH